MGSNKYWYVFLNNKILGAEFALKFNCKIPKIYWKGSINEFKELDLNEVPNAFVLKPSQLHSSRGVYLMVNGKDLFTKQKLNNQCLKENFLEDLSIGKEQLITSNNKKPFKSPKIGDEKEIIIEELIKDNIGEYGILQDYKFYMFNGVILFIEVINRVKGSYTSFFYDENWNQIKEKILVNHQIEESRKPLQYLEEMKTQAIELSKVYDIFVRIDFFESKSGAIYGKFTPFPRLGKGFTDYGVKQIIQNWDKYCKGKI
jgi:hypothetical protein